MNSVDIIIDDLSNQKVIQFLHGHLEHMIEITPPGCVHALDIEAFKPARNLYTKFGFTYCEAVSEYTENLRTHVCQNRLSI